MGELNKTDNIGTSLEQAVTYLRQGGIVAFPTETYYGLGVDPDCAAAVSKLFTVKQRREDKPVLLLLDNYEHLADIVEEVPEVYRPLIKKYWPGPLTFVFQAKVTINWQLTGGSGTLGVRMSPHPLARKLLQLMGKPITATSANLSGNPPARSASEVAEMLGNSVDYIVDGGTTDAGLCSTILGVKDGKLHLFRRGQVDLSDLFDVGASY